MDYLELIIIIEGLPLRRTFRCCVENLISLTSGVMLVRMSEPQVLGRYIEAVTECALSHKETSSILEKLGLSSPQYSEWYPLALFHRFLLYLMKFHGDEALFEVGKCLVTNTPFPDRVSTVQDAFRSLDLAYTIVHRNQHGSMYGLKSKSDFQIVVVAANPYPCPFDWGIIQGITKRFAPNATVSHDFSHGCRLDGDPACHYTITF